MRLVAILFCLLGSSAAFSPTGTISIARSTARPAAASVCMGGAATKPMRVNMRNREYNKKYKSEMKTRIKTVLTAVAAGEYAAAFPALAKAQAIIDKNVSRGIIHKNTAARRKSLLTLKVKALEASSGAVAPVAAPAEE
ncbi:hypothetical protein AB1Y20_015452 [Prymnesium parvum]|uniref:30S ribosomal protein S20 n=1 Tax=Prymnesium parvum TaxID=97485 RepID=A0AB34K1J3_PRYPA